MNGDAERRDRSRTPSPLSRSSSRSSIGHSSGRTTLLKRNQSLSAKQIRFYRNGDRHFAGLKLAVSSERYKEFFPLLVELSNKLDLPTGAVRFIFDAESGREVTDVSQLNTNSSYVCSSMNSYREIEGGYGQTQSKSWSVGSTKGKDRSELTNWGKSSPRMEGRREFIKPKLVTVVKNGKPPQKKVTMLLNKKTAVDLNQVLDHLSSKGTLGKVDRLCCLDGREIKELRDLFSEDMIFIAFSSNERFPEEGFDVDVQSPQKTWKTSIKPTLTPYMPSLRTELDLPWKQLPRARCLACALRALTTGPTPPPQSHRRPRPKSAGPRLSHGWKTALRSEARPSSAGARYLQPRPSRSPRKSPTDVKDGPKSNVKSSNKTPRVRQSYPKTSTPRPLSAKKSLSFSADTKAEETDDSTPKPKGIRGGGRRRKAQLELADGEELDPNNPQHAYYILVHEDLNSGKPTASVKPMMSGESEQAVRTQENGKDQNDTSDTGEVKSSEIVVNGIIGEENNVAEHSGGIEVKSSEIVVNGITGEKEDVVENSEGTEVKSSEIAVSGITEEKREILKVSGGTKVIERITYKVKEISSVPDEEKPAIVQHDTRNSSPVSNEEKPAEYWSKPKPIRGRKRKPKSDVNGNEQDNAEAKTTISEKHEVAVNGGDELQPTKLVLTNGDCL